MPTTPMSALQTKLKSAFEATKRTLPDAPWDILADQFQTYEADKYAYSLRLNTIPKLVHRYAAFINAANLYTRSVYDPNTVPFRMVERRVGDQHTTIVEAKKPDDTSFLVVCTGDTLRISSVEPDGSHDPICSFANLEHNYLTWIALALFPHVLKLDEDQGNGAIANAVVNICRAADDCVSNPWQSLADVPDIAKEAAYFLDAVMCVFKDHMRIDCGDNRSDIPAEVPDTFFSSPSTTLCGALLCEYVEENGWQPKLVTSSGQGRRFANSRITIGEAKAMFSHFTAHRNWTAEEKKLIPQFPDDTPVMPEILVAIKHVCDTRNDMNPVVNLMWRGVTGYGKSTGVKQMACILNIPLLIMTCKPETEAIDFLSTYVPDGKTEELLVNTSNLRCLTKSVLPQKPEIPFFDEVLANFETLNEAEQNILLDLNFLWELSLDTDSAVSKLLGREESMAPADASILYTAFRSWLRESHLWARIAELEAAAPAKDEKNNQPSFVHVLSPFIKAIMNGYLIEVQEASRIRNQGVLVSNNEIMGNPGSTITLMNGYSAVRHKDALVFFTDNVGYNTCNLLDPSVLGRFADIEDSFDLPKDLLMDRLKRNTGVTDTALLERCWKVWNAAKEYHEHNGITEGVVSLRELQRFVQYIKHDGEASFLDNLQKCIISKASSSREDQKEILAACTAVM